MNMDKSQQNLNELPSRWAELSESIVPPTMEELRAHPLLRAMGVFHSGVTGLAERHDEIIAEDALDSHADE
jgi:hypothetical protein